MSNLGSHEKADGWSDPEVRLHVAIARDCMSSLQREIWKSGIRINTKLRLLKVYIIIITYPSVWRQNLDAYQGLVSEAAGMSSSAGASVSSMQRILRISFSAHVTNTDIYQR